MGRKEGKRGSVGEWEGERVDRMKFGRIRESQTNESIEQSREGGNEKSWLLEKHS